MRHGLYISPHLVRIEERIALNDQMIDARQFAHYLTRVVEAIEKMQFPSHPTYFDTLTATAFLYFAEQRVDLAVLEVGMGGRLDSTNVAFPLLSIVTPVGMDHQQFLGNTLEEIAKEKGGIMRCDRVALVAPQKESAMNVLRAQAAETGARLRALESSEIEHLGDVQGRYRFRFHGIESLLPLYGRHQVLNAALTIQAAEVLRSLGWDIPSRAISRGFLETQWPGRLQKIAEDPPLFLDGAHNPDAAQQLAEFALAHTRPPRTLVFGIMKDKDIRAVLQILVPCFEQIYLTQIPSARAASPDYVKEMVPEARIIRNPSEACQEARKRSGATFVAGSFYLVGEVLKDVERATALPRAVRMVIE